MQLSRLNEIENPISRFAKQMRTSRRVRRDILLIKEVSVIRFFCQELHQVTYKLGRFGWITKVHKILTTHSLTLKYKFYKSPVLLDNSFIQIKYTILFTFIYSKFYPVDILQ